MTKILPLRGDDTTDHTHLLVVLYTLQEYEPMNVTLLVCGPFISVVRYKAWLVTYNMQVGQVRWERLWIKRLHVCGRGATLALAFTLHIGGGCH